MNILLLYQYATWCGLLEASGQRLLKYVGKQFWQCSEHKSSYQRSIAAWRLLNVDRHMMLWLNLKNIVTTGLEQSPDEWVLVLFKKAVHINLIDTEKEQRESHWQGVGERPRWCQAEGNLGSGFVSNGYWAAITKRERIIPKKWIIVVCPSLEILLVILCSCQPLQTSAKDIRTMHYYSKSTIAELSLYLKIK